MASGGDGSTPLFKLLLCGDSGVGKSSILLAFADDTFDPDQPATIGVDFKVKLMNVGGKNVKLNIWDTAGQERFRTLTSSYYRGAHGVIMVYAVDNKESFNNVTTWMQEVNSYCNRESVAKMLVGNRIDLTAKREVSQQDGVNLAKQHGMMFMECSAKTRQGIQQAFDELVAKVLETPQRLGRQGGGVNLGQATEGNADPLAACGC